MVLDHQYSFPDYPDGGIRTSAREYAKLVALFLEGGRLGEAMLLQPPSIEQMLTPGPIQGGFPVTFGLGLYLYDPPNGEPLWGHDGDDRGISSVVFFDRTAGLGVLVFGNTQAPDQLDGIRDRLFDEFR